MVYAITIIIMLIGVYRFDIHNQNHNKTLWYRLEWAILVFIAGLRYKIGGDTYAYMEYFETVPDIFQITDSDFKYSRFQPLFIIFVSFIRSFSSCFLVFQLCHAILVNSAFFYFFRRNSEYPFTAVLFYALFFFLNYNTEIIRVSFCTSIFLFSYSFLVNKQWLGYAICILVAYGFHGESLLMLLFPICHLLENDTFKRSVILVGSVVFILSAIDLLPIISNWLSFNESIQHSFEVHSRENNSTFNLVGLVKYILNILLWFYFIWLKRNECSKNRFFIYIALICYIFATKYSVLFGRAMDFVYPILIMETVNILYEKHFFAKRLVYLFLFYCWSNFYFWNSSGYYSYKQYFPYVSYLDPYEDPIRTKVVMEYHPILAPK